MINADIINDNIETIMEVARNLGLKFYRSFPDRSYEPEDLMQEVAMRIIEKGHRYDPNAGCSFKTFASRIGYNYLLDQYRKIRLLKKSPNPRAIKEVLRDIQRGMIRTLPDHADKLRRVREVVWLLPPILRRAANRIGDGASLSEAARKVGLPPSTMRDQLRRHYTRRRIDGTWLQQDSSVRLQTNSVGLGDDFFGNSEEGGKSDE